MFERPQIREQLREARRVVVRYGRAIDRGFMINHRWQGPTAELRERAASDRVRAVDRRALSVERFEANAVRAAVPVDVAFGGAFYAIVDAEAAGVRCARGCDEEEAASKRVSKKIRAPRRLPRIVFNGVLSSIRVGLHEGRTCRTARTRRMPPRAASM